MQTEAAKRTRTLGVTVPMIIYSDDVCPQNSHLKQNIIGCKADTVSPDVSVFHQRAVSKQDQQTKIYT